ncbi:MAG: hypothetical protein V1815_00945 [Candidatus Woesearchaeota archaeon]
MSKEIVKDAFNLEIICLVHDRMISGDLDFKKNLYIKMGDACKSAILYIEGQKNVTNKGQIFPGSTKNISSRKAILELDKQVSEMIAIGKILAGGITDIKIKETGQSLFLRIHYLIDGKPDNFVHHIKVKNRSLYLE